MTTSIRPPWRDFDKDPPKIGRKFVAVLNTGETVRGRYNPDDPDNGCGVYGMCGCVEPVKWRPDR